MMRFLCLIPFVLIMVSCQQAGISDSLPPDLVETLAEAEELRFRRPEYVDVLLSQSLEAIEHADNDELWAQYYFIQAHVEMSKGHFDHVTHLVDSINICKTFQANYEDKIILMNALLYEKMLLYESSYGYYKKVARLDRAVALTNDELLIALLGKVRIQFWLMSDYKTTFNLATSFVAQHDDVDLCIYHSNGALLDGNDNRSWHLKMSEQCAMADSCHYQLLQSYIQHAAYCREQDSIAHYLGKATQCLEKHRLDWLFKNTIIEASYLEIKSKSLKAQGQFDDAMVFAQKGIDLSLRLRLEDKAYRMCVLLSDMQFALGQYTQAMASKDQALNCRLAYAQRINSYKIKYLDVKERADILKIENDDLLTDKKSKTLQVRFVLVYSFIVSFIIYLLYSNRRKINDMLNVAKRTMRVKESIHERYKERNDAILMKSQEEIHRKDMMLKDKEERLTKITSLVKDSPYKDKSKLIKIENLVTSVKTTESWDLFYEVYQYKYPKGEKSMRTIFPSLAPKDYQYLMCVHYGLSHEKMAVLFSIQKDSVRKRSLRLKKTFGISPNTDIKNFLLIHISE